MSNTRLQNIYYGMKKRCYSSKNSSYKYYGLRGITICDEWLNNPKSFYKWALSNGYRDDLTIDRIDINKGYSPDNCRWVTRKIQQNNRRTNNFITYNGETKTVTQWAEKLGLTRYIIRYRLKHNWDLKDIFETSVNADYRLINFNGKVLHLKAWCDELHLNYSTVKERLRKGWSIKRAFETPIRNYR